MLPTANVLPPLFWSSVKYALAVLVFASEPLPIATESLLFTFEPCPIATLFSPNALDLSPIATDAFFDITFAPIPTANLPESTPWPIATPLSSEVNVNISLLVSLSFFLPFTSLSVVIFFVPITIEFFPDASDSFPIAIASSPEALAKAPIATASFPVVDLL